MSEVATRLLQGYLWHPANVNFELSAYLPAELAGAQLLFDEVRPPFAFFENGELTSTQRFYQFTALRRYRERPSDETLHAHALALQAELGPTLEATPPGVGWQLWEDLRDL